MRREQGRCNVSSKYTVRVSYVDDSYWDDGSRWTSHTFKFTKLVDAVTFARDAVAKGCKVPGQCAELLARPDARDIDVERHSTTKVDWAADKQHQPKGRQE